MSMIFPSPDLSTMQARAGQLGQQVDRHLGQLLAFNLVSMALLTVCALLGLLYTMSALGNAEALGVGLVVLVPTVVIVGICWGLWLAAMRAARRAVSTVAARAAGRPAPTLGEDTGRLNAWLTAWQWLSVLSLLLTLLISVPAVLVDDSPPEMPAGVMIGLMLVTTLLTSGPVTVLTWLVLKAVKGFFGQVGAPAAGVAVTPAAQRVGPWLEFTRVILWISLGLLALYLLFLLGLGVTVGLADSALGRWTVPGMLLLVAYGVLIGWVYLLMIRLVGDSRLFALQVAATLDQEKMPPTAPQEGLGVSFTPSAT